MKKPNLKDIMKQAQEMQKKVQAAQNELANKKVTGEAGGGLVKITMTGHHDATKVEISREVYEEDKEILEDLVAAAINDAARKVEQLSQNELTDMTAGLELPPNINPFADIPNE